MNTLAIFSLANRYAKLCVAQAVCNECQTTNPYMEPNDNYVCRLCKERRALLTGNKPSANKDRDTQPALPQYQTNQPIPIQCIFDTKLAGDIVHCEYVRFEMAGRGKNFDRIKLSVNHDGNLFEDVRKDGQEIFRVNGNEVDRFSYNKLIQPLDIDYTRARCDGHFLRKIESTIIKHIEPKFNWDDYPNATVRVMNGKLEVLSL